MRPLLFIIVALCSFVFFAQAQNIIQQACKGTVGTFNYDLTNLSVATGGQDMTVTDSVKNVYYYRPCMAVSIQECGEGTDPTPAACQRDVRTPPLYHDCGTANSAQFTQLTGLGADKGFNLSFTGGSDGRQLNIEFYCDSTAGVGSLENGVPKTEDPQLHYHLRWRSALACPIVHHGDGGDGGDGKGDGKKGGDGDDGPAISGGWIFIICLVGVTILYFAVGAVVNKFVRHKEGIEIIPNVEFWMALPGLVKDGHLFVYKKLRGLCGRGGFEEV